MIVAFVVFVILIIIISVHHSIFLSLSLPHIHALDMGRVT
jgi:hypothetical protein